MADNPARGLADVVAASTALSDVDGVAGRLYYRGYDIHDLAGRTSFEETVHLLVRGTLPTRAELDALIAELAEARTIGASALAVLPYVSQSGTPMEALRTLVSALSVDDPDASDSGPEANQRKAIRLGAAESVKRVRFVEDERPDWLGEGAQSVYAIRDFLEFKTTWHPVGA